MTMHYVQDTVWDQIGAALVGAAMPAFATDADADTAVRMTLLAGGVPPSAITEALVAAVINAAGPSMDAASEIQLQLAEANILPLSVRGEVEALAA